MLTESPNPSLGWLGLSHELKTTRRQWKLQPVSLKTFDGFIVLYRLEC